MRSIFFSCFGAPLIAALCGFTPELQAAEQVRVDGSSTVYPISEAVAEEFQMQNPNIKVTVGISGTGGGFKKFTRGEIDISNASRPITSDELVQAKANGITFVELPIAFDALTVMVNPANTWVDYLTVAELKKLWEPEAQGKLKLWSQIRPAWPAQEIKLYGPGADSGTFDYFTEAIVGKAKASRGDYTASEDDNVLVRGIQSDKNALGYFGYAYYVENKHSLRAVPIVPPSKDPSLANAVLPSSETVASSAYHPLARPIFIYANAAALKRPEVRKFVDFYLAHAAELASEVRYVPLPQYAYDAAAMRVSALKIGTAFAGHSDLVASIDEILKRELKIGA